MKISFIAANIFLTVFCFIAVIGFSQDMDFLKSEVESAKDIFDDCFKGLRFSGEISIGRLDPSVFFKVGEDKIKIILSRVRGYLKDGSSTIDARVKTKIIKCLEGLYRLVRLYRLILATNPTSEVMDSIDRLAAKVIKENEDIFTFLKIGFQCQSGSLLGRPNPAQPQASPPVPLEHR